MCVAHTRQELERQTAQHTTQHNGGALFPLSPQGVLVQEQQVQHSTWRGTAQHTAQSTVVARYSTRYGLIGILFYSKIKRGRLL